MFAAIAGADSMTVLPITKLQKLLPFMEYLTTAFAFERGRVWNKRFKRTRMNPNKTRPAYILEN